MITMHLVISIIILSLNIVLCSDTVPEIIYNITENEPPRVLDPDIRQTLNSPDVIILEQFESCGEENSSVYLYDNWTLAVLTALNREVCADYRALIFANEEAYTIKVEVWDENDNSPYFECTSQCDSCNVTNVVPCNSCNLSFEEGQVDKTKNLETECSPQLAAKDKDGIFGIETYRIVSGNVNYEGTAIFDLEIKPIINSAPQLHLVLRVDLDVDEEGVSDEFSLTIEALDSGSPPKTATAIVNVKILDKNDNSPNFEISFYKFDVFESALNGSVVGEVHATDKDSGDFGRVVYYIKHPELSTRDPFEILPESGQIIVTGPLDHETVSSYSLIVRARDSPPTADPRSDEVNVDISLIDINEHPPLINFTFFTNDFKLGLISEDYPPQQSIARIDISDLDSETAAVEIAVDDPNGYFGLVDCNQRKCIALQQRLDRESQDGFTFAVEASETVEPFRSVSVFLTMEVLDANDNSPEFNLQALSFSVREDADVESFVGQVFATDADLNQAVSFEIIGETLFDINNVTGEITLNEEITCESLSGKTLPLTITVRGTDSGRPQMYRDVNVEIDVIGIDNREITFIPSNVYRVNVSEAAESGYCFLTVTAVTSSCISPQVSYTLLDSLYSDWFTVESVSGEVCTGVSAGALDFETVAFNNGQLTLSIEASVSSAGEESGEQQDSNSEVASVVIHLEDFNEFKPSLGQSEYRQDMPYSTPVRSVVLKVSASDQDAGPVFGAVTFAIESGNEGEIFDIEPATGEIRLNKPLPSVEELELNPTFELSVTVVDGGGLVAEVASTVLVTVVGLNLFPPTFTQTVYHFNVSEGPQYVKTVIGSVAARYSPDGEESHPISYAIHPFDGSDSLIFTVNATTGAVYVTSELDAEESDVHIVTISATSDEDPMAVGYCQIEVTVTDVNDVTPIFTHAQSKFNVKEDLAVGDSVGQVTAYDGDISAPNNEINFEVSSRNDVFEITNSGLIQLKQSLDYETETEMTLELLAYDSGESPVTVSTTVTVFVQDVNDNKPVFTRESYFYDIREDLSSFESIGTVLATDEDSEINSELVYSLKSADAVVLSVFGVDSLSGVIYATRNLDYEEQSSYEFEVVATDLGEYPSPLSGVASVVVQVLDANDEAPQFNASAYSFQVDEGSGPLIIGQVFAIDPDAGLNGQVRFSILINSGSSSNDEELFAINSLSGVITSTPGLDREEQSSHVIEVAARDLGDPSKSSTVLVYIHLSDVNDNAPRCSSDPYRVLVHEFTPTSDVVIVKVHATDDDSHGPNSQLVYALSTSG